MIVERKAGALDQLSELNIPHTIINYPTLVENPKYLYDKLEWLMKIHPEGICFGEFQKVYDKLVDPKLLRGW
jgi:hypothetical protein